VHPEIRAENIQRINAEIGRRRPFQPRYGQPECRPYVPPERLLEGPRRDPLPQPDSQLRQEVEELRQQMRDMQRERQPQQAQQGQGTDQLGQGTGSNGQALGTGQGPGNSRAPDNLVTMIETIETGDVGMLSSALEDMNYEDVLQWEGPDPNPPDKRKRAAVSDGEVCDDRRPRAKRPAIRPVGSGHPGQAIPEDELASQPPIMTPADLGEKRKRRSPKEREPIRMMKGQPKFNTVAALRDTEVKGLTYGQLFLLAPSTRQEVSYGLVQERPPRKGKGKAKEKVVATAEPVFSTDRPEKVGCALPESGGRIVNFYTAAPVTQPGSKLPPCTLKRVLVYGGSVLNMMPLSLARRMALTLVPQKEIVMKTAASTFHEIKYYVNLTVTVADVTATIRCYCLPETGGSSSYTLLLGRRWMKQVQALGDYSNDTYHIHDMAGYRYKLEASEVSLKVKKDIPRLCTFVQDSGMDRSSWDRESANELKMSRNDLCKKLYQKIKAQVTETETETDSEDDSDETDAFDADSEPSDADEAEYSDDESGNEYRHEVSGLRVAAKKRRAARFRKN